MKLAFWPPNVLLSIWAWFAVVLHFSPSCIAANAYSSASSSSNHEPNLRAALVSVVHESDLPAILSSVQQLEQTFNADYQYDWVFFSAEPLSDTFRSKTSNATRASCLFEVIPREHWRSSVASSAY